MVVLTAASLVATILVVRADTRSRVSALQNTQTVVLATADSLITSKKRSVAHALRYLSQRRDIRALAGGSSGALDRVERDLAAFLMEQSDWRSIDLIDADRPLAVHVARTHSEAASVIVPFNRALLEPPYMVAAMASRAGHVYITRVRGEHGPDPTARAEYTARFATPLVDDEGLVHGVIAVDFDPKNLFGDIDRLNAVASGRLFVVSRSGEFVHVGGIGQDAAGARGGDARFDQLALLWARQHRTPRTIKSGMLMSQREACVDLAICRTSDGAGESWLHDTDPWDLLHVFLPGQGGATTGFSLSDRPYLMIFGALAALLTLGLYANSQLLTTVNDLDANRRQLRRHKTLIESLVVHNPVSTFIKERSGRFLFANQTAASRFGVTAESLVGRQDSDFLPADQVERLRAEHTAVLTSGAPKEFTVQLRVAGGDRFYSAVYFPVADSESGQVNVGGFESDITARVETELLLQRQTAILRATYDAAPDGIMTIGADGLVESANAKLLEMYGRVEGELVGCPAVDLMAVERRAEFSDQIRSLFAVDDSRVPVDVTHAYFEGVRGDGSRFPVELACGLAVMSSRRLAICHVRDVTQRRQLEAQLLRSQKMDAIGRLASGLAHDYNNLLTVILGNLDFLRTALAEDVPASAYIQNARTAAKRGATITTRLLAFSRKQALRPRPHDVNAVMSEVVSFLPGTLGPTVQIVRAFGANLPPVAIDAAGFESVLLNLAINARDAMTGGGTLTFASGVVDLEAGHDWVLNHDLSPGRYVVVTVSDTGCGISEKDLARVFEPFFTTKQPGRGTGLGLSMVYGYLKQSGGHVSLRSDPGLGTTVELVLPTTRPGEDPAALKDEEGPGSERASSTPAPATRGGTILVVEDEAGIREVIGRWLVERGYRVLDAADGPSALAVSEREHHIDLLITDFIMPGKMNGADVAGAVRERHASVGVIYMSGTPIDASAGRQGRGIEDPVVGKPFTRTAFLAAVQDRLRAHRPDPGRR